MHIQSHLHLGIAYIVTHVSIIEDIKQIILPDIKDLQEDHKLFKKQGIHKYDITKLGKPITMFILVIYLVHSIVN